MYGVLDWSTARLWSKYLFIRKIHQLHSVIVIAECSLGVLLASYYRNPILGIILLILN